MRNRNRFLGIVAVALLATATASAQIEVPTAPASIGYSYTAPPAIPTAPSYDFDAPFESIPGAAPATAEGYDLEGLLALASRHNPTLQQARLHVSAELAKALQAGLYPNPILSYEGEQIFLDVEGDTDSPGEFQGGVVEQRFVTAGKLRLSREKYLRRAHVSEHQVMAQRFRVCNDVRIHFYRALAADERLAVRRELLKTAEDGAVTAQESYNMGQARRPDVRRANIALQRGRLEVMRAENDRREAFRRLAALVGVALDEGELHGDLSPRCEPISYETALGKLLAESPELAAARAKLSVDRATIDRESVEWMPDLVVRGGAGYNYESRETVAVAGLAIEAPLFDRNQGTVRQARLDYARQRREVERVELELRDRLARAYQRYATALQHAVEYERMILPESRVAYAELLESYRENRVDWSDVLIAQHEYFDARLEQVDNLVEARTHEVLIHGYLLHDGLMAAAGVAPPGHIDAVPKPR